MGKIKLRVGEGVKLTSELLEELARRFGCEVDDIDVEYFGPQDDLQQVYSSKKASIADAFRFAMDAWPPSCDKDGLEKYLAWCDEQCPLPEVTNNNVADYQEMLGQYLTNMLNGVIDFWPDNGVDAAIKFLNKADQYNVMRNGRPDLVTLSVTAAGDDIVLRWDEQLPACSQLTLTELETIKRGAPGLTPNWFRELSSCNQLYLQGSARHLRTGDRLTGDLYKLQQAWAREKSRDGSELFEELMAIREGRLVPDWYAELPPAHKLFMRELSFDVKSPADLPHIIDGKFDELTTTITELNASQLSELDKLRLMPYWYVVYPEFEQKFLQKALAKVRNIADVVFFIPSRLRTIPGLSNFRKSHSSLYRPDGQMIRDFGEELCFSHVASRDVNKQSPQIRDLHSDRNIERLVQEGRKTGKLALFLQTLVSPSKALAGFIPDFELTEQLRRGVARVASLFGLKIFTSNHPFNAYKYWGYTTEQNNPGCNEFLAYANERLNGAAIRSEWSALFDKSEQESSHAMLDQCLGFIKKCPDHRIFGQLLQLAKKLAPIARDKDHCLAMIKAAWADALLLKQSPERLTGSTSPVAAEAKAHLDLLSFFSQHSDTLSIKGIPDWSACLANLWYLSGHANKPVPDGLNKLEKITNVAELIRDYTDLLLNKSVLDKTVNDYNGREMTLAMQEGLLARYLGDVQMSGSCISGKDRKGLYLLCVLAAEIFHHSYGYWPNYSDTGDERKKFVEILSDLYVARHDAVHSGQNAPGADGIKHPHKYFPNDVVLAIERKIGKGALQKHDRIASNNELKDIPLVGAIQKNRARCVITALKLGEEGRTELLERMKIITGANKYWASKVGVFKRAAAKTRTMATSFFFSSPVTTPAPAAVEKSRTAFANTASSSMDAIMDLFMAILDRPVEGKASTTRDPETQGYYNCILALIQSQDPRHDLPNVLKDLDSFITIIKMACPEDIRSLCEPA